MLYAVVILARFMERPGMSIGRVALVVSGSALVCAVAIWHGLRWGWIGAVALIFMMFSWMLTAMLVAMPDASTMVLDLSLLPLALRRTALEACLLVLLLLPSTRRHF
jgi:hypothetical protein